MGMKISRGFSLLRIQCQLFYCLFLLFNVPRGSVFFFLKMLFIHEREHKHKQEEGQRKGETGSLTSREPNAGLDHDPS